MKTLTLELHGTSPESLQIDKLGDYLKKLSALYGKADRLYLDDVSEGSACLNVAIDDAHAAAAESRVVMASDGKGPKVYRKAYQDILKLLERDNYGGDWLIEGRKVLTLSAKREDPYAIRTRKPTSIKGKIFRVGGTDETVPVRLKTVDGAIVYGETNVALSKELGGKLYDHILAHGEGEWVCDTSGGWKLTKLTIKSYETIEHISAKNALLSLRDIGGISNESGERIHADILEQRG